MNKLLILRNEVERLKAETCIGLSEHDNGVEQGRMEIINTMMFFIDDILKEPVSEDLEKEVDFDAEWKRYFEHRGEMATVNVKYLAKHFFELGLKAQQEPVSEDLEEEVEKMWAQETKCRDTDYTIAELTKQDYEDCARYFANWQKKQDIKLLFNAKQDGYRLGLATMKQQMIDNAVDGAFIRRNRYTKKNVLNGLDMTCDAIQGFKDKDKIKVLFIKED